MKVSLSVSGGLLARLGTPRRVVDSDELAEHDSRELHRLVSAAMADGQPAGGGELSRDARTYRITVDHGSATTVLRATDGDVPEPFAALRDWLQER